MRILIVSSYLPYPLYSGGAVRLYNIINELSKRHQVTLVCEKRPNQTADDLIEVEKICKKVYIVSRKKQWSVQNVLTAGFSQHSFLSIGHTLPKMHTVLTKLVTQNKFDVVHIETFYVSQNVPETNLPVVLVEHNIEYLVYTRYKKTANRMLQSLLSIDIEKMRKEEEAAWSKATLVAGVSQNDIAVMRKFGIKPRLVANGVNPLQFTLKNNSKKDKDEEKRILFIGDFKWIQNRDAGMWIVKEIWPQIITKLKRRGHVGSVKLWIVGRQIPQYLRQVKDHSSILFDSDSSTLPTEEIFQQADILLAPIRVGGGTSYKILEAMSTGTVVVTTKLSADALQARDQKEIMVGDTVNEISDITVELLLNRAVHDRIALAGRRFVENNYSWTKITGDLETVYTNAIVMNNSRK